MTLPLARAGLVLAAVVFLLAGCAADRDEQQRSNANLEAFHAADAAWRADRLERLQRPDGWLALVAREWLLPGRHGFGSDPDAGYRFEPSDPLLGELELDDGRVWLHSTGDGALAFQGAPPRSPMDLTPPVSGASPRIDFDRGRGRFEVIARGERFALRVMHEDSPTRTQFVGLDYFTADPAWRIDAAFEAHEPGRTITIINVLGDEEAMDNPGRIAFEHDGTAHTLEAVASADGRLFVIFADRSNREETYGAGRFVYTDAPEDGQVVIDFNRAYNPPCAFSAYTTCPLPPPENRLDLMVDAGERRYAGPDPSAAYAVP